MADEGITLYIDGKSIEVPVMCTCEQLYRAVGEEIIDSDICQQFHLTFAGEAIPLDDTLLADLGICPESRIEFGEIEYGYHHVILYHHGHKGNIELNCFARDIKVADRMCQKLDILIESSEELEPMFECEEELKEMLDKFGNALTVTQVEEEWDSDASFDMRGPFRRENEKDVLGFDLEVDEMVSTTGWFPEYVEIDQLQRKYEDSEELFYVLEKKVITSRRSNITGYKTVVITRDSDSAHKFGETLGTEGLTIKAVSAKDLYSTVEFRIVYDIPLLKALDKYNSIVQVCVIDDYNRRVVRYSIHALDEEEDIMIMVDDKVRNSYYNFGV